MYPVIHHCCS